MPKGTITTTKSIYKRQNIYIKSTHWNPLNWMKLINYFKPHKEEEEEDNDKTMTLKRYGWKRNVC